MKKMMEGLANPLKKNVINKHDTIIKTSKLQDPNIFMKSRTYFRDERGFLNPYTNWEMYTPNIEHNVDVCKDPEPLVDERLLRYKGVYDRMAQGKINDEFGGCQHKLWNEELFSRDTI